MYVHILCIYYEIHAKFVSYRETMTWLSMVSLTSSGNVEEYIYIYILYIIHIMWLGRVYLHIVYIIYIYDVC